MTEVIQLAPQRTCFECEHYILTPTSSGFCWLLKEQIDDEKVAAECEEYRPWLAP